MVAETRNSASELVPDDEELVERSLAGDAEAFEVLVKRYGRTVYNVAGRFFRQPEMREDITQETFLKAYQALHTYRRGASFERWLMKIAVNACYDELRRMKRRREFSLADLAEDERVWLEEALAKPAFELFEQQQQSEDAAAVAEKLLATLSPEDRLVMLLYERDGLSTAEIGDLMGWSRSKVKIRLFRARRALDKRLRRLLRAARPTSAAKARAEGPPSRRAEGR
ncbi:ECF RNA polymerase sigma-E factor [bacterium HR08]|nr:ECF RNA polymerase sigma-E factor [bacterium HR08]